MNRRMTGGEASLNAPMRAGEDGGGAEWQDWLVDEQAVNAEAMLVEDDEFDTRMNLLQEAMSGLNEREKHILTERRLTEEPRTLEDLSTEYGVSRERIRQIEVRAFEKLQKAMKKLDKEMRADTLH